MNVRITNLRLALSASAIALFALPSAASAATCVWNGGTGNWSPAGGWSACAVPASVDDVSILAGGSIVNMANISAFASTLNLASGNTLNISNSNFYIYGGAVTNNGTINIANGSQFFSGAGAVTFGGTGVIALDNSANYAYLNGNGQKYTFGSGQMVRGAGSIGVNNTYISNAGLFSADVNTKNISVDAAGGSGGVGGNGFGTGGNAGLYNTGAMEAKNGGTLSFESGLYENSAAGVIRALNGSTVSLNSDARIVGGTLTTVGTGVIKAFNASQYLTNVTLSTGSTIEQNNDNLYLNSSFVNNGTLKISNGSQLFNELGAGGALTISGAGTIILDNAANFAYINGNGGKIIFGSNQSVQGSGSVGVNNTYILNNNIFSANTGSAISIDAAGGSSGVGGNGFGTNNNAGLFNTNIIEATGNSTVSFESGLYENGIGAAIRAVGGSTINLNSDSRILGGTLTSDATSLIKAFNASQYLTNVTLSAGSRIDQNNDNLYLNGSFTNNGTLKISNGSQLFNELGAAAALTISGAGTIILDNAANFAYINGNGGKIIFGSNQSITGSGSVGVNNSYIVNNNVFSASGGGAISIDGAGGSSGTGGNGVGTGNNAGLLNNGIIEAIGGSIVSFESGLYENVFGGIMRALGGSTINLNSDSRIVGGTLTADATSTIKAFNASQYLTNVTLSAGSKIDQKSDNLYLNNSFTSNGTLTVREGSQLFNELGAGGALTIGGTGTIVLDNSLNFAYINGNGGKDIFGAGLTIRGKGNVGVNNTYMLNNGLISADTGTGLSIDAAGGSGGVGGNGFGTGSNSGLLNTGTLQATNGSTLSFESGLYENSAAGTLSATGAGSTVIMNSDANLTNLQAGNVLNLGTYVSSTNAGASTLNIRGTGANSIATIGTGAAATDTTVTLSGANSLFNVTNFGTGVQTTLDSTLFAVAGSGQLNLLDGRNLTIAANGGAFSNSGLVHLGGSAFSAASFNNAGTLRAISGINSTSAVTGPTGTIETLSGATLNLGGASTAGFLKNNGALGLGTNNIIVTSDYTNAAFGSGNAFAAHANVTGTGLINATSATMDLSGPNLAGNILNVGNVRTGGSSSTTLKITNNGTATTLRGAVQNILAPSVALAGADWAIGPNGGNTTVTISYTGLAAGSLSGQSLGVVNNFDNVADRTIGLVGNIYQVAQAAALPASLTLGARRVGDAAATAGFSIANVAPVAPGFNEDLQAVSSVGSGFTLNGLASATAIVSAGNTAPVTLSHGTATAGSFGSTVNIANTSLAVAGSGLADLALAGQAINVIGNVYAKAVATLSATTVSFGTVRKNAASPNGSINISNTASGALTDSLVTSTSGMPAGVTATAPGALTAGQTGAASFALNTSTAGIVSGSGSLDFKSTNGEMADLVLASKSVTFSGTITELASGTIFKNSGAGIFAGSGNAFTLDLGSLTTNTGVFTTDLGVTNLVVPSAFAELLGGSFSQGAGAGYTFAGNSFGGLAGGLSNLGNLLSFDTTGLANGTYTKQVTFNGFSAFTGLNDFSLTPINVNVTARVTGSIGGAVPENATWMMMLFGFGLIGSSLRRTRVTAARQLV